jgi:HAD superfamily phosphoserine phosphatase-like hydrolase
MNSRILVTDFDGTMTTRDFFLVALSRLPSDILKYWRRYEAGEISHFEALAGIYAGLRVDEGAFSTILSEMGLESETAEAVRQLQQKGWKVVVASAGCSFYIEKLLAEHGLSLTVHANPGFLSPDSGLVMELPKESPYFSPAIGIDKPALVNALLGQGVDVAYAGDGRLDLEPLLLLPAERRFARGWLAANLEKQGEPFIRFNQWGEIAARLLNGSASCLP